MAKKKLERQEPTSRIKTKAAYPYYLLKQALKLGKAVADSGGDRAAIPKSVLSQEMDLEQNSSVFGQIVATAKTFGIVTGTQDLQLTDLGRDYFFEAAPGAARRAELGFFASPGAFAYLIKRFDGAVLPNSSLLANFLGRELSIPASWQLRVAQIFASVASDLNILDQANRLRYASAVHQAGSNGDAIQSPADSVVGSALGISNSEPEPTFPSVAKATSRTVEHNDGNGTLWVFKHGDGVVRVETPPTLTRALWTRLKGYVDLLEPEN